MYKKLFLRTAIPFGASMALFALCGGLGLIPCLLIGAGAGFAFGLSMTMALSLGHLRAVRRLSFPTIEKWPEVNQAREITMDLPYEQSFDACLASFAKLPHGRILSQDRKAGKIVARKRFQKTWGDTITITLQPAPDNHVVVHIDSRPALRTIVVDYGSNLENVEIVLQALAASSLSNKRLLLRSGQQPVSGSDSLLRSARSEQDSQPQHLLRSTGNDS